MPLSCCERRTAYAGGKAIRNAPIRRQRSLAPRAGIGYEIGRMKKSRSMLILATHPVLKARGNTLVE